MTDFLDELEMQLIDTVQRYAPDRARAPRRSPQAPAGRRHWRERLGLRHRSLVIVLAALMLTGAAAAAVVVLTPSMPLSGTIAGGGAGAPIPAGVARYRITAFPYLAVGWTGWCTDLTLITGQGQTASDYGCGPVEDGADPSIGGEIVGSYEYELFTREVVAVRFAYGRTYRPARDPHLPPGTWGIFVVNPPQQATGGYPTAWPETWLNAKGQMITQPQITNINAVEHLPLHSVDPRQATGVPCAVSVDPASEASPIAETVSIVKPWPRPMAGSFESCSNATFRIAGSILAMAVLINATDPSTVAAPLTELQPDPGHVGLLTGAGLGSIGFPEGFASGVQGFRSDDQPYAFNGSQPQAGAPAGVLSLADHDITARRIGLAWLLAEGGTPEQRAALLAAATVAPAR